MKKTKKGWNAFDFFYYFNQLVHSIEVILLYYFEVKIQKSNSSKSKFNESTVVESISLIRK